MTAPSAYTVTRPRDTRENDRSETGLWKDQAACRTWDFKDGDPWFEPAPRNRNVGRFAVAREICRACPVRDLCLRDVLQWEATATGPREGFVGGLDPDERTRIARFGKLA